MEPTGIVYPPTAHATVRAPKTKAWMTGGSREQARRRRQAARKAERALYVIRVLPWTDGDTLVSCRRPDRRGGHYARLVGPELRDRMLELTVARLRTIADRLNQGLPAQAA